jgi:clan AA aspartic protease
MMTGHVLNRHLLLPVTLRLPNQPDLTIEFCIDTGFTDYLTLPAAAVAAMHLPYIARVPADLADDSTIEISVHAATILWNGIERDVRVLATGRRPLLGTALLDGNELVAQFAEGGLVTVESL